MERWFKYLRNLVMVLLFEPLQVLCDYRKLWEEEVLPGLVANDSTATLCRMGTIFLYTLAYDWKDSDRRPAALLLLSVALFCALQFICANKATRAYKPYRWFFVLALRVATTFGCGNTVHFVVVPAKGWYTYAKDFLMASGLAMACLTSFIHREMFCISIVFSIFQVYVLWQHSEEVCENGLLASNFGIQLTRRLFNILENVIGAVSGVVWTQEPSSAQSPSVQQFSEGDLKSCVCMMQTLQGIFGIILPNVVVYLSDKYALEVSEIRQRHQGDGRDRELQNAVGYSALATTLSIGYEALRIVLITGVWLLGVMRLVYSV